MFVHIRTQTSVTKNNSNLTDEKLMEDLLEQWSDITKQNKDNFKLFIFNLTDIISWDSKDNRYDYLLLLLEQGRAANQLVVLQMDNERQLEEINNSEIYKIIMSNTIEIN